MYWIIIMTIVLVLSIFTIKTTNIKIDYNPYQKIISWDYNTIDKTNSWSACLTWKIIDIWIESLTWEKQYLFFPNKTWDDNSYKDWIDNINKDNCKNELINNYTWHFDSYTITNSWILLKNWKNTIIIWKYIFK